MEPRDTKTKGRRKQFRATCLGDGEFDDIILDTKCNRPKALYKCDSCRHSSSYVGEFEEVPCSAKRSYDTSIGIKSILIDTDISLLHTNLVSN